MSRNRSTSRRSTVEADAPGGEHRRLAHGTLIVQAARAWQVLALLIVATALGRELPLTTFGVYGLTLSIMTYVSFLQGTADTAAMRSVAQASDQSERDEALTTSLMVYAGAGAIAAILLIGGGTLLIDVLKVP